MNTRRFNRFESFRRSVLAGGCFVVFGALALLALLIPLPILLMVTPRRLRERRVRGLASLGFRLLIRMIEGCGLAHIEVRSEGIPDLAGCLLIANHPSYLDAVFLMAHLPHVNCVMKSSLLNHPLFFPFTRLGGYIASDSEDPQKLIEACRAASDRGEPILIFPEGTRSTPGKPLRFRRGAAQVALRAGLRVVPLVVHCDPPALTHGYPWYRMPDRCVHLVIRFAPPCEIADFAGGAAEDWSRLARHATRGLENYYVRQLSSDPHEPLSLP